ncbi:FAD-binding domain-containing protein [Cryphonectria parasitica EP155]|uniref:FAD-binding domain-containing protein n=1 Tax=Cryphonectria parasitica (strain ATCC 38755 / EP155) TaxID=660469 RepID=A0A9P5CP03_CRYP1|nr:FAD-binding domain-containing protein [Cryphonectria parasitica EP155]KAF3764480.1 FAD-binding domain-containing protein [Cryphonectria parasitica EP155]
MPSQITETITFLRSQNPGIQLHTAESPAFADFCNTYIKSAAQPSAVARPRSIEDVQAVIKACTEHGADFNIRAGGHNAAGRTLVDGALLIDMRELAHVEVSRDKKTAKVAGGALAGNVMNKLGEQGLVTPIGTMGSVGYVGWCVPGGYGAFSALYGLGCDQILGAKLVDYRGELVEADEALLKGIRGAGLIFGAIVELTVKVYPLKEMLSATFIFESSDMEATWARLTTGLDSSDHPPELKLQTFSTDFPGMGPALACVVTWVSDDHRLGREWIDKVAAAGGKCLVSHTEAKTPTAYAVDNEKLVVWGVHGRSYTLNLRKWTPASVAVLAEFSRSVARGGMIAVHALSRARESDQSVFGAREDHLVIEIIATSPDPTLRREVDAWGVGCLKALREADPANVLDSAYISLLDEGDLATEKIYGEHLPAIVELKRKYDPANVFKHSSPKIPVE